MNEFKLLIFLQINILLYLREKTCILQTYGHCESAGII